MSVVVLTGATGFVGRSIHRYLARRGHEVRAIVRPDAAARLTMPADRIVETPDIFARDADWWAQACDGADAVIHAAWYVEHGRYLNAPENAACVQGSFALAQGAVRAGVRHVIGVGTCMEYRLPGESLSVEAPLQPANFYAACKLATFHMMRQWFALHETRFSWCRLFYLHGEGEHPDRIGAYLHRQLRAGEARRIVCGNATARFPRCAGGGRDDRPCGGQRSAGRDKHLFRHPAHHPRLCRADCRRLWSARSFAIRQQAAHPGRSCGSGGCLQSGDARLLVGAFMKAQLKPRINLEGRTALETVIPLETPFVVFVDPASACNFQCKFCPTGHRDMIAETGALSGRDEV
jgi:dTDP-6-deoxy-L-talose 4-dehydrogenase (NAD+)